MLEDEIYFAKVVVAFGQPPEEGQEGRFEFLFDVETNKKPKVLPDGSVAGKHDIFSRIKFAALNRPLYRKSPSRMDFSAADHTSMYKDIPVKIDIAGQHIYILIGDSYGTGGG